jgi:hypothetical protein
MLSGARSINHAILQDKNGASAMAKKHGAKQQKRLAKQKAKRQAKRSVLARRTSKDPTIRLQRAEKWPVVQAMASTALRDDGIGYLVIARQEPEGGTVFASFLVDIYCLGVKDAFWDAGTMEDFREMIRMMEEVQSLSPISPACLAKIVKGAVEYAQSFGFSPHPDYRHASLLLEGIDPSTCREEFEYGKDGKPFYFRGPNESLAQARAIAERMAEVGGHYMVGGPPEAFGELEALEDDLDEAEDDDDEGPDPSVWRWRGPEPGGRR